MTGNIVEQLHSFRNNLFDLFVYRSDTTMDLIDAIAGQTSKESAVKISLFPLFRRTYSSITDAVDNLFRRKADIIPQADELKEDCFKITNLIAEQCPHDVKGVFHLFAVDCSSISRIYSDKLEDRGFVHSPTKVTGQKPITIGHQYSNLVYLPERLDASDAHWVIPLSTKRIHSKESSTVEGIEQMIQVMTKTRFKDELGLLVSDSAYSCRNCTRRSVSIKNLVSASRMRNNRIFHNELVKTEGPKKRGRPKTYGERWALSDPKEADDCEYHEHKTASGISYTMRIERWRNKLDHGESEKVDNLTINIGNEPIVFDAIRVTMLKSNGQFMYKKPLWLMVTGDRRREINVQDIAKSYLQRFDIEHYFRFAKQKLLLVDFQTPDVRHEENWWWLITMSYTMLYLSRQLGDHIRMPWESKRVVNVSRIRKPTQVQRSYERIIGEIGTPACVPKLRGKSVGRLKGSNIPKRKDQPIVKKTTMNPKNDALAAA